MRDALLAAAAEMPPSTDTPRVDLLLRAYAALLAVDDQLSTADAHQVLLCRCDREALTVVVGDDLIPAGAMHDPAAVRRSHDMQALCHTPNLSDDSRISCCDRPRGGPLRRRCD